MTGYEKGFPEEITLGEGGMSVDDVNRMMLSLSGEKCMTRFQRKDLMRYYAKKRQEYLDERYEMTPEQKRKLLEVERLLWKSQDETEALCRLHVEQEQRKREQGIRIPIKISYHLEVGNVEIEDLSDVESDVFNLLCAEERYWSAEWGYKYSYYDFEKGEYIPSRHWHRKDHHVHQDGFSDEFHLLKDNYALAWQDMEMITRFWMTVDYCYSD